MAADPLAYRVALGMVRDMGVARARRLMQAIHGDAETFFTLEERQLASLCQSRAAWLGNDYRRQLLERARRETAFIQSAGIHCTFYEDPAYPPQLLSCADAPVMLYGLGHCPWEGRRVLAVVGTRHATPYGVKWVEDVVAELAQTVDGLVVVSGLAYGIDIAAHRAALRAGIPTVAVLGHGLQMIYPAVHRSTAVEMVRNGGALITEYTSQEVTHPGHFLARNRIVAGLSQCVAVAESAVKGGAMATARIALEYSREVCALPGRVTDPYSQGTNRLIAREVAHLVTSGADIARVAGWPAKGQSAKAAAPALFDDADLTDDERRILVHLRSHTGGDTLNAMVLALDIPVARLTATLTDMEFRDLVQSLPGARYAPLV